MKTLAAIFTIALLLAMTSCSDGGHFIEGPAGEQGTSGADGQDGLDGSDGVDGQDGVNGILEVIDPCGDFPGAKDEILLRLYDGTLVAFYMENHRRFLTIVTTGNYRTSDGQECRFSVDDNLEVTW